MLGVFIGNRQYQMKNWEGMLDKVSARLSKWEWLLPQLSYRGRVLVANNLAASTLWHRCVVMDPPEDIICGIQRKLVIFFWSGEHWVRASVIFLPVCEGGHGLVDVKSRIHAFRLQAAKRFLYQKDLLWTPTACAILQRAGGLGLDKHLFLMKLKDMNLSGITPFYRTMFHVWRNVLKVDRDRSSSIHWAPEEPLFFNNMIQTRLLSSVSVRACLLRNGIVKLGHLMDKDGWKSVENIKEVTGLRSQRLVSKMMEEISLAVQRTYGESISTGQMSNQNDMKVFPRIKISSLICDENEGEVADSILNLQTPQLEYLDCASKKALYHTAVKVIHQRSLKRQKASRWLELLGPDFLVRDRWRTLYKLPVEKRTGDLQWRIIHGAIATDRHVAHLNPAVGGQCRFCGEGEDLEHLFLKCNRLNDLFELLVTWFQGFAEEFSDKIFIGGLKYRFLLRRRVCLLNYLIGTAKLAIWKTRKNKGLELAATNSRVMCMSLVAARLRMEFTYYSLTNNVSAFCEIWCINEVLCVVHDDQLVLGF